MKHCLHSNLVAGLELSGQPASRPVGFCTGSETGDTVGTPIFTESTTLYDVQNILCHSDPKVTQRYAHLSTKSLQAAADSDGDIINAAMPESS